MPKPRPAALAVLSTLLAAGPVLAGGPTLAATCNLTVQGTSLLDDAACTVGAARGTTRVTVGTGGAILIRRSLMSARLPDDPARPGRRRVRTTSYGQVTTSTDSDDKTCYFNQRAVLCIEP